MSVSKNNKLFSADKKLNDLSNIKEFINTANSRLDAITSITKNSHAIAADAVTAMICENQDSVNSKTSLNTTNKMSVCLRDGEIILRIVAYLLISNDESVLEKSCLKDLKNTYLALGVPLRNARREKIEQNATTPTAAINKALAEFNYGSNGSTESEELLQLPSNGNQ